MFLVTVVLWFSLAAVIVWQWGGWALLAAITLAALRQLMLKYAGRLK